MNCLKIIAPLFLIIAMNAGCEGYGRQNRIAYTSPVEVEDEFQKGINRPPTAETLYRMAKLLEAQGKDDQAYATLLNAIERYPDYVPAYTGLAALQIRQRKFTAGTQTLERAMQIAPNDPVVLNDLGMSWLLRDDYERALQYFTQASEKSPDDARYRANMALATGMMGRYDEAYSLYEEIMRPARAHYNVGVVAEARNDMDRAVEEYARAKALDSTITRKSRNQ